MNLISWNVNGFRAVCGKGLGEFVAAQNPEILCLQEVKARRDQVQIPPELAEYHVAWNAAEKPGYSGVAVFSREQPIAVNHGLGASEHDREGRLLTLEFPQFFLVNVYTPNSQDELRRLDYRLIWDAVFLQHIATLARSKPLIFCGDLNVAHLEIDIARPAANRRTPGFTDEERGSFGKILDSGFIDSFRHFHPDLTGAYSWWSYRGGARQRNVGWRLDYFGVSDSLEDNLAAAAIHPEIIGSDHCPVSLTLAGF